MAEKTVTINLIINNVEKTFPVEPNENLLDLLRRVSYPSVKRGCDTGDCGVCVLLLDGQPVRSCMTLAVEADGHAITTLEGLSDPNGDLHPVQQAFIETGAIQCGFCTPSMILASKALLDANPAPSADEIRASLSGVLCRCTGYVRIIEAVQRAAAVLRGEAVPPVSHIDRVLPADGEPIELPTPYYRRDESTDPLPPLVFTPPDMEPTQVVGQPEVKVDAVKLAKGKPVFTDDIQIEGMLTGALLTSPHAHARIKRIDASRAR
ncbi:MAG: 2Fe-2S iron-sulfur cluster binding domain-containing protein, partial [Anaerolineae bacterium]|nr:2Fe-2S iron-sulfur cluster binding domain-containing protein [Anaerolineae bacterium]